VHGKAVRARRRLEIDVEGAVQLGRALTVDAPAAVAVGVDGDGACAADRPAPDARQPCPPPPSTVIS
jgi:hypothetical protein